ncbi:dihydroorotase, partial [Corallococcus praedator]
APHAPYEKEVELDQAPFGILGLETEFAIFCEVLVHQRKAIGLPRLIELLTINPAKLLRIDRGTLSVGAPADVTLLDPDLEWTYDLGRTCSPSRNSPFHGQTFRGRAVRTIVGGRTAWKL